MAAPLRAVAPGGAEQELIVYDLIDPQLIWDAAVAIEDAVLASCPLPPISGQVSISAQGCLRFIDPGAVKSAGSSGVLPRTDRAAATIARDFIQRATDAVNRATHGQVRDLFNRSNLQHGGTKLYSSPKTRAPEVWVSIWQLSLPSHSFGSHALAPVIGGTVTIRIAGDGRIVGLISTVRPIVGRFGRPPYRFSDHEHRAMPEGAHDDGNGDGHADDHEPADEATDHPSDTQTSADAPIVVYVAEGPECPQRFLAPCYVDPAALDPEHVTAHGHSHSKLWPACDHTLIVQISVFQREDGASLRAILAGPGGEQIVIGEQQPYRLFWGFANQAEFIEGTLQVDEGPALELNSPGLYHVELTVEHVDNGCFATTFVHVPVLGNAGLLPRPHGP